VNDFDAAVLPLDSVSVSFGTGMICLIDELDSKFSYAAGFDTESD
jgi:hypothetical protein